MATLKQFWATLTSIEKDQLRSSLAESLYVSTMTANAYINERRNIPMAKRDAFKQVVLKKFKVHIELNRSQNQN